MTPPLPDDPAIIMYTVSINMLKVKIPAVKKFYNLFLEWFNWKPQGCHLVTRESGQCPFEFACEYYPRIFKWH